MYARRYLEQYLQPNPGQLSHYWVLLQLPSPVSISASLLPDDSIFRHVTSMLQVVLLICLFA